MLSVKGKNMLRLKLPHIVAKMNYFRTQAEVLLRGKPLGTFLCRPAGKPQPTKGGLHTHTIDVV